ncbi:hypothetical protein I203_107106 [Kwoniella mangroviensis CBS 8507]|uniref:hypothetical protein n=1 Tax=Kwoniella mangroviensis CBS 8507 TaxID=1296122 RepID=UPI00080D422A|nr:uncharacterized protein I203_01854 [Kwoniella mangroviensis CBS 8507]OCF68471.1 hypothetical protein I203_01854 [Kwoniella mangroviensis CBS 8507]
MSTSPIGQHNNRSDTSTTHNSQTTGTAGMGSATEDNSVSCGTGTTRTCYVCHQTCSSVPIRKDSETSQNPMTKWLSDTLKSSANVLKSADHSNDREDQKEDMSRARSEVEEAAQGSTVDEGVCRPKVQVQFRRRNPHDPPRESQEDAGSDSRSS